MVEFVITMLAMLWAAMLSIIGALILIVYGCLFIAPWLVLIWICNRIYEAESWKELLVWIGILVTLCTVASIVMK